MTAPAGGWSGPPPGRPARRPSVTVWLAVLLTGLVTVLVAVLVVGRLVVDGRGTAAPQRTASPVRGSVVPDFDLVGEWSGEASLARCAGLDDCAGKRTVTLTIQCSGQSCVVTPFDPAWGRPPLRVRDGAYRAAGPVPGELAPTCDGVPASTATWRLELTVLGGRLVGSYAEFTVQGFDCGGTGVSWNVVLDRA